MWVKCGTALILAGALFYPLPGRAERAWEYAREWEKKQADSQVQPADKLQVMADKQPAVTPAEPAARNKPATTKPKVMLRDAVPRKKPDLPATAAPVKRTSEPARARALPPVAAAEVSHTVADPVKAGLWFRKLINAVQLTPDEQQLRASWRSLNEKYQTALAGMEQLNLRDKQRQALFEKLQRRLKEEQRPALPEDLRLREDFAEGMAAGMQMEALLTNRKALGLEIDRTAFLAGLREAMRNDSRMSEDEFHRLLAGAHARLAQAEAQRDSKRQEADKKWLAEFRRQPHVQQSGDGVFYQKIYAGDRQVGEDEVLTVGLVRRLTDDTLIEDSDISGRVLKARLKDYPVILRNIIKEIGLHGEAQIAMPVNRDGIPDTSGPWTESWTVRNLEATAT
ncbi:FKBP-type peptidyl-prolyl cis-trans isomerase N-terminal domain-containing protein [Enterobacter sp.]|uniref:FKBP-type peptidyl-prolyl cis-trans isomerase N-terminal domain-containing protein n=1 Tax=Enterobacter sp. TaxID=42895 RepID=UPI00296F0BCE|nr:FKBP-type peptidyl-prolyl cis-trans isomerase N-terminal domain-containing protein [Enterobacter sp.]